MGALGAGTVLAAGTGGTAGKPPVRIVGTTNYAEKRAAGDRAESVKRIFDLGDIYDSYYGNVYVDWDSNQDWSTATETQIMTDVDDDTVTYTATVNVPSDASTGSTLARVRLSRSQFYGPDTDDEYGEVEDFTIYVE
jgi:hypothetical protein